MRHRGGGVVGPRCQIVWAVGHKDNVAVKKVRHVCIFEAV